MKNGEPWVEKYRPTSLNDVVSQSKTIRHLKKLVKIKRLQHIILTGSAGNGKTSTIKAMINDFYKIHYPDMKPSVEWVFERNASEELRASDGDLDDLKHFIDQDALSEKEGFKFVILEESDRMSNTVQSSLRRIIETAPENVKFMFTNNYLENLIDPIISRCGIFRFYPVPKKDSIKLVKKILKNEGVKFTDEEIDIVYTFSRGDLRKLINNLQIISKIGKEGQSNLYEFFGILTSHELKLLFKGLNSLNREEVMNIINKNLSPQNFVLQIFDKIIEECLEHTITQNRAVEAILCLEDFDMRFISRSDINLQLRSLVSSLSLIIGNGDDYVDI